MAKRIPLNTTQSPRFISRRQALANLTSGYGTLALASMLHEQSAAAPNVERMGDPLAPRRGHHAARAKRVIFLFMPGGPSHVDLFDPKPLLTRP